MNRPTLLGRIVLMILPALFLCRQAQAQEPQIRVGVLHDTIDVCSTTRSLIVVYVDNIARQDSILGYDIEVRYNPEQLYLTDELFVGTLTELFDDHKLTFPEPGVARGWAANTLRPVATSKPNQPLIAMAGTFLGDCSDTVHVEVTGISFAHVADDNVVDILGQVETGGVVSGTIRDQVSRHSTVVVHTDTLRFRNTGTSDPVQVTLTNGIDKGITTLEVELVVDRPQQFGITDITAVDPVQIVDIVQSTEGVWRVHMDIPEEWSSTELLSFRVTALTNRNDTGSVAVRPVQVNKCACVTRLLGSGVELLSEEEVSVGIPEQLPTANIEVRYRDGGWVVHSRDGIRTVRLVTLSGQIVAVITPPSGDEVFLGSTALARGLYLMQIHSGRTIQTIVVEKL